MVGGGQAGLAIGYFPTWSMWPTATSSTCVHDGIAYFFCTLACAGEFARAPDRFVS